MVDRAAVGIRTAGADRHRRGPQDSRSGPLRTGEDQAPHSRVPLGAPFDLSDVMFICTGNVLDTIPGPLRDRMEVIQLPGYTAQEKLQIAKRYLLARQLAAAGLTAEQCEIGDDALLAIINDYTRE